MKRFIQGENRNQSTLFPGLLDDYISDDNQIRVIDAFIDTLDLSSLGFSGIVPKKTGRPSYHPSLMLKLYVYGYLNRVQSSRRLERESQRNVELMWLISRLAPDFKTIADFRKKNGKGIQNVCRQFIDLCRQLELFTDAVVANGACDGGDLVVADFDFTSYVECLAGVGVVDAYLGGKGAEP